MGGYLLRRLALILPTLLGILLINFAIVQAAPGGPVDQAIACLLYTSDAADDKAR
ncbi:microcin ABC transporter permease, partial [Pseudomonas aeruginosa]|nr:microcin ABC transporter permease [Pseudomonas aeruginosa]